ncbi:carboxymuconolactone decarboxylase family protein [Williamsia deligens]|uniref:Carboxymuconolactone decarboxylase family protein n=1 Tax=Williamsia deligens TaxID=321325 RepID=A0ABW3G6R1_9NOCA|nr:carboxymuconolactone decarboxylase family protein [Williamsia deligens]MCP2193150.1 alkylhydroperoxidase AhpD family core domain-containing protein [Williamsia deligens]
MTQPHVFIDKQSPAVYRAFGAAAAAVGDDAAGADIPRVLVELINVRVSQINGCAFCLDLHTRRALAAGETSNRLATLPAWRDTELFDDTERAALRLAEMATTLPDHGTQEREYEHARSVLSDAQISAVVWTAIAINAFNRVSILSRHPVRQ